MARHSVSNVVDTQIGLPKEAGAKLRWITSAPLAKGLSCLVPAILSIEEGRNVPQFLSRGGDNGDAMHTASTNLGLNRGT